MLGRSELITQGGAAMTWGTVARCAALAIAGVAVAGLAARSAAAENAARARHLSHEHRRRLRQLPHPQKDRAAWRSRARSSRAAIRSIRRCSTPCRKTSRRTRKPAIGNWTDDQIVDAIRNGKRPDGTIIGPPMAILFYRGMSDTDVRAIVAYLRHGQAISNLVEKSSTRSRCRRITGRP